MSWRPLLLGVLVVFCSLATTQTGAQNTALDVTALVERIGARGSTEVAFTERRESPLLADVLVLEGTFRFKAPDTLVKTVRRPYLSIATITGDELLVDSGGREPRGVRLADVPALEALVAAFRSLLAGDAQTLLEHYDAELSGEMVGGGGWQLRLLPRLPALAERVANIEIVGADDRIERIVTTETNGDRAVMALSPGL